MAQPEFFACDTETVWAKLQSAVVQRELKVGSRVTLTEYATAVVTGRPMMPSEWSDWLRWISRQSHDVGHILWLQRLDDEQYEKIARSKKSPLEPGDLEALQKIVSQWNEWSSWFATSVADVASRVLEEARAGRDAIFGRAPNGQIGPLGLDVLHLPIKFDAAANSFVFDGEQAKRLHSSFTATDVPGWTDIAVLITEAEAPNKTSVAVAWLRPNRVDGQI